MNAPGNGFHVNWSVKPDDQKKQESMIAGVLDKIVPMTVFFNPVDASYERLGQMKAPRFVSWSRENRSQLVRIPAAAKEYRRAELRRSAFSSESIPNRPQIVFTRLSFRMRPAIVALCDKLEKNLA